MSCKVLCPKFNLALAVMQAYWCINRAGMNALLDVLVRSAEQLSLVDLKNDKIGTKIKGLRAELQPCRYEIHCLKLLI